MKKIKLIIVSLFVLNSLFFIHDSAPGALAQQFSAGVNPTILEIEAVSPADIVAPIRLENASDQTITYGIFLRPFKAGSNLNGEPNYDPTLATEYEQFFSQVQVFDGANPVTEISLGPKEKKDLSLRIKLDSMTQAQDYYFTIFFLSKAEASAPDSNQINLRAGIGTNVLLTVGTKSQPEGRIASFSVPAFSTKGPIQFSLELANHSDFYASPKGSVVIKNMFGQAVGNPEFGPTNILANSNRLMSNNGNEANPRLIWNNDYPIGIYKAELAVAMSETGPLLNESKMFVAIPVKAVIITVAIILFFIWLIKSVRRKSKEI